MVVTEDCRRHLKVFVNITNYRTVVNIIESAIITVSVCNCLMRARTCISGQTHRTCNMDAIDYVDFRPALIGVIIVLNIVLNGLALAVIVRYPQLREDRTTLFIFSLTLSDLANGCTAMPISAALCSSATPNVRDNTTYFPKIHAFFSVWFTVTSMHSLCWVTLCKIVAITNPLRYEQVLTRTRCYVIICVLWLVGALMAAIVTYYADVWDVITCVFEIRLSKDNVSLMFVVLILGILCPVAGLVYSTIRIFRAILRAHRQITAQVVSIGGEINYVAPIESMTMKSIRSGRNVLIVCLALVVLTIPYFVTTIMTLVESSDGLPSWFRFGVTWMCVSNTFINSLIYLVVFRSVRDKTVEMFRAMCYC